MPAPADGNPDPHAPNRAARRERRAARIAYAVLWARTGGGRDRRLSAMIRIRNESEFLEPAVRSLAASVDEVVLIDNRSTDGTAAIIARLRSSFPDKTVAYRYDHEVARVGTETWKLATEPDGSRSPRLTANYYNWCLERCSGPYVLKWDADMIALDGLRRDLELWKRGSRPVLVMQGVNVHPDLQHVVVAKNPDRVSLLEQLEVPGLPLWVTRLTHDYPEPRLFPKLFARYTSDMRWTQALHSPFYGSATKQRYSRTVPAPAYLHLKFCKRDPLANYSRDLAAVIAANVARGAALEPRYREELVRWGVPGRRPANPRAANP
ncbi:MAG: glycosyltransferase [Gemmatimonadota bacterium]|nr:MAG: glycosyltransferase [Gemmatimonadota bacterium]